MPRKLLTASNPTPPPPGLVLDTNVVLDWLVFADPATVGFVSAIESAQVCWQVTPALRDELAQVLARGLRTRPGLDACGVWRRWEAWSTNVEAPPCNEPEARFCCSDPDDQKFIDLAMRRGARWLLSRDKAVLKLAKRVEPLGLAIITPRLWCPLAPSRNTTA